MAIMKKKSEDVSKLREETLKHILYRVIQTTEAYLVSIFLNVMQKCQTIELSDYQTVELAIAAHPMFHIPLHICSIFQIRPHDQCTV